jgi:membrane protein DedA with SNARE-associated domain
VIGDALDWVVPLFENYGLWIVFFATFIESGLVFASVVPGETMLIFAGFLAAPSDVTGPVPILDLPDVMLVAFAGAVLGDLVGYLVGRIGGRAVVQRFGRFFFLPERRLPILERYFVTYGGRAILFGRFAPFLRSVRTLVAGIARMPMRRFLLPDIIGAAIWAAGVAALGFVLGESWRAAETYLGVGGLGILLLLVIGFSLSWRGVKRRVERELAESAPPPGEPGIA